MTDIDASAFANPARQPSPDTCRRAALTVCRSALGSGGTVGEVRDVLEHLGLLDELREESA